MKVIEINDYLVHHVDKICNQRFSKDIMLVFNDYREDTKKQIVNLIHQNVSYLFERDILLDYSLIKIVCSMFLGLSWSMYRKGKNVYKKDDDFRLSIIGKGKEYLIDKYISNLNNNLEYEKEIEDITIRYYTLYMSRYNKEIINRTKTLNHDNEIDEMELRKIILNIMRDFSRANLILGIKDEIINEQ